MLFGSHCKGGALFSLTAAALLALGGVLVLTAVGGSSNTTSGREELPTRGVKYYLEDSETIPDTWNEEKLYVVAFLQNEDRSEIRGYTPSGMDSRFYTVGDIANSYTIPVDGHSHTSGLSRGILMELFTFEGCQFSPAAKGALHNIVEDTSIFPAKASVIEYHYNVLVEDEYRTMSAVAKANFYNVSVAPTTLFDGVIPCVGGGVGPNDPVVYNLYMSKWSERSTYQPLARIGGSGSYNPGDQKLSYNVSVEITDALPRGNWTFNAFVCEDRYPEKDDYGAYERFKPRFNAERKITDHFDGAPFVAIDREATFGGIGDHLEGDLTINWSATDDGGDQNLRIDLYHKNPRIPWESIAQDLDNTGSYVWTTDGVDRVPDTEGCRIKVVARDQDGKMVSCLSGSFEIDNPDFPEAGFFDFPEGQRVSGRTAIRWTALDDEDGGDLLVRLSIANDTSADWETLTYKPEADDFVPNSGELEFNTANLDDLDTYRILLEVVDRDDMMISVESPVFGIYNNDRPRSWVLDITDGDMFTGELQVGWKAWDEEDDPTALTGNISIRPRNGQDWTVLREWKLPSDTGTEVFPTDGLPGDGDYIVIFKATDSMGLASDPDSRAFTVYDPDPPVITGIYAPSEPVSGMLSLTWTCSDPDAGETLIYDIDMAADPDGTSTALEWTAIASDLTESVFEINTERYEDGIYSLRVTATDSSPQALTDVAHVEIEIDNPDAPVLKVLSPVMGEAYNGTMDIVWDASDPDGDNVTVSIQYRIGTRMSWDDLEEAVDLEGNSFSWNFSSLDGGSCVLRLTATDISISHLTTRVEVGPITLVIPEYTPEGDDEDDLEPVNNRSKDDTNYLIVVIIVVSSILLTAVMIGAILFIFTRGGSKRTEVMPEVGSMDLSIPEFERTSVVAPTAVPQTIPSPATPPPFPPMENAELAFQPPQPALGEAGPEEGLPEASAGEVLGEGIPMAPKVNWNVDEGVEDATEETPPETPEQKPSDGTEGADETAGGEDGTGNGEQTA